MNKKKIIIIVSSLIAIIGIITIWNFFNPPTRQPANTQTLETKYWTCGMHPSVRVTDKEYKKGTKNCPICNMPLIPVEEEKPETPQTQLTQQTQETYYGCGVKEEGHCPKCDEGKPDAQCICGGHSFMIKADKPINCPVCGRPLKKLDGMTGEEAAYRETAVSRVNISRREAELAGVMIEPVKRYRLTKTIRTVGKVAYDPGLSVAQEEFLTAVETSQKLANASDPDVIKRADDLVEKSKFKLRLLGMSDDEIADLEREGKAQMSLVLPEDKAWVYAEVYEYELGWVKTGQEAVITTTAYPGEEFKGIIKQISPVLNPMTRSATVRIEANNVSHKLKPQMYSDVIIKSIYVDQAGQDEVLAIPKDAVLDTGTRKIVYVEANKGVYIGKEVRLGPAASVFVEGVERQLYPVIEGLSEGENVVTKANFLLDSQSQISPAAAGAYGGALEAKEEVKPPLHQH